MYTCMYVCMDVDKQRCVHVGTYVYVYTCAYVCIHIQHRHIYIYIYMHVRPVLHVYIDICISHIYSAPKTGTIMTARSMRVLYYCSGHSGSQLRFLRAECIGGSGESGCCVLWLGGSCG